MKRSTVVAVSVLVCVFGGSAVVLGQQKPLHEAVAMGDVAQIKHHIDKKADLNALDAGGNPPLKLAVEAYNLEVVKLLLDAGVNPNKKDSSGNTPLMVACMSGQKDVVEALLAGKADLAAKNTTGLTALHCGVMMGQIEVVATLIQAGADVNAKDNSGQTAVAMAQRRSSSEMVELLRQHGATMPVVEDPYGMYGGGASQAAPVSASTSRRPEDFQIDPNVIREELQKAGTLEAPLKVIDANSNSEQRTWIARRSDNRTAMLRAVQKQFEDEMAFVKKTAAQEKASKTTKAVDDLTAARKKRYERIGAELREQRRQTLQESRATAAATSGRGGRGTTAGRSMTGRAGATTNQGAPAPASSPRTSRRTTVEAAETPIDADTQAQIQAWLTTNADDKSNLLKTSHELDVVEYAILSEVAKEEQAVKTHVGIMALLMLREERIAKIQQKWVEDDERTQRMQERAGANGMQPSTQSGTQRGTRRGGR